MKVKEFLELVAHKGKLDCGDIEESEVWLSNFDDSYLIHVGLEDKIKFLADREITEELTHGVGFSPKDNKWYGWSHRAIYGFTIGSTCKKGDCHYRAASEKDEIEAAINFWSDENHINVRAEKVKDGEIIVSWECDDKTPNEKLRGTIRSVDWQYDHENFGKGEWVAETMEEAKRMAQDFNEGVS